MNTHSDTRQLGSEPHQTKLGAALGRRTFLQSAALILAGASFSACDADPKTDSSPSQTDPLLLELDQKIETGMEKYSIPGVGLGLLWRGGEYVRGYGLTALVDGRPVSGNTLFRIASNTKIFTGTTVMCLVERGEVDLDERVQSYLPDFATLDPTVAGTVTVRQLLNHTAGWVGDNEEDTGSGDDALARLAAGVARAPQLNPPGVAFDYNNLAIDVAGRIVEVVTGQTYEEAVQTLVLDPLKLTHTRFFGPDILTLPDAVTPHVSGSNGVVASPTAWNLPRGGNPDGGLISTATDMLAFARFHLGDGSPLLTPEGHGAMQNPVGPGGTLVVELDGMGVTWMLRPSAEGVRILQHGGAWSGQHSGFMLVPEREFALVMLTNSDTGPELLGEFFADDWALRRFAQVSNLPATAQALPPEQLTAYEGRYLGEGFDVEGNLQVNTIDLQARPDGQLTGLVRGNVSEDVLEDPIEIDDPQTEGQIFRLGFYKPDFALVLNEDGENSSFRRANFLRADDGRVTFLRYSGRLFKRA